ncbi:MAG: peptide MFS transporter [Pseudomonadota bacterium]
MTTSSRQSHSAATQAGQMGADQMASGSVGVSSDSASFTSWRAQPRGLSTLFFVELWERFSYYGMRALLTLFMVAPVATGGLGFSIADAALLYGNYTMAVYLLSIPGGFIADKLLGAKNSVIWGGLIIAAGHFALAVPTLSGFYSGLILVALGTGLFKPNISALVGGLYKPDDPRRDAGFSIFYMGINIGAFIAPIITGFLAQSELFKSWLEHMGFDPAHSWHWGFGAAGVGMTVAIVWFLVQQRRLVGIGDREAPPRGAALQAVAVLASCGLLLAALVASDRPEFSFLQYLLVGLPMAAVIYFGASIDISAQRVGAIFVFFIAGMVFWAAFEQAGLSIALVADQLTDNNVAGMQIPSAWYQSLNPLFVMLLAPLFAALWLRMGRRQPSTPIKFSVGLALLSASFLLMVPAAYLTATGQISPLWLVGLFALQTMGELCLSPVGLSAMTKLAPPRMVGLMLGVWFLGAAFGNKLAGILGTGFSSDDPAQLAQFFLSIAAMTGATAVAMLIAAPWVKKLMHGVR